MVRAFVSSFDVDGDRTLATFPTYAEARADIKRKVDAWEASLAGPGKATPCACPKPPPRAAPAPPRAAPSADPSARVPITIDLQGCSCSCGDVDGEIYADGADDDTGEEAYNANCSTTQNVGGRRKQIHGHRRARGLDGRRRRGRAARRRRRHRAPCRPSRGNLPDACAAGRRAAAGGRGRWGARVKEMRFGATRTAAHEPSRQKRPRRAWSEAGRARQAELGEGEADAADDRRGEAEDAQLAGTARDAARRGEGDERSWVAGEPSVASRGSRIWSRSAAHM